MATGVVILGPNGKPARDQTERVRAVLDARRAIKARYDAAQTSGENRVHWAMADSMSARAANSAHVRHILRNRSRYEAANNCYAKRVIRTLANDLIGTGPRLQLLTDDVEGNRRIEQVWNAWTKAVRLASKLRTMCKSLTVDGEAFGILTTNPRLPGPVQLDVRLVEADQVSTPDLTFLDPLAVDGVRFDEWGNPVEYHVLKTHPGDDLPALWDYDRLPARAVIHWFICDRPGQCRGIPEIMPALPLFAQLRRYTLAVLAAAETAADFSAVLESDLAPDAEPVEGLPFEELEIARRLMMTLPAGHRLKQLEAQQPTTEYGNFKREIVNEMAGSVGMPFNIAAGNSSGYNYSSGRLDHQTYYKSLGIDQADVELIILDRLFMAWLDEMSLASDLLPAGPERLEGWPHQWIWDGRESIDPEKEAKAQDVRLKNHTTTLADEYARRGLDWETQLRQRAKELALMEELGLTMDQSAPSTPEPATTRTGGGNADSEDEE